MVALPLMYPVFFMNRLFEAIPYIWWRQSFLAGKIPLPIKISEGCLLACDSLSMKRFHCSSSNYSHMFLSRSLGWFAPPGLSGFSSPDVWNISHCKNHSQMQINLTDKWHSLSWVAFYCKKKMSYILIPPWQTFRPSLFTCFWNSDLASICIWNVGTFCIPFSIFFRDLIFSANFLPREQYGLKIPTFHRPES